MEMQIFGSWYGLKNSTKTYLRRARQKKNIVRMEKMRYQTC